MSVSQNFTPIPEKKKLKADINENTMNELELYLQAAQEDYDWLTLDAVVEQLLEDALKKDRTFRSWLKKQKQREAQQSLPLQSDDQSAGSAAQHSTMRSNGQHHSANPSPQHRQE